MKTEKKSPSFRLNKAQLAERLRVSRGTIATYASRDDSPRCDRRGKYDVNEFGRFLTEVAPRVSVHLEKDGYETITNQPFFESELTEWRKQPPQVCEMTRMCVEMVLFGWVRPVLQEIATSCSGKTQRQIARQMEHAVTSFEKMADYEWGTSPWSDPEDPKESGRDAEFFREQAVRTKAFLTKLAK